MPWVRIDDGMDEHQKLAQVGKDGLALQVIILCYCNRNLTDGHVHAAVLAALLRRWEVAPVVVDAMVEANILERTPTGVYVHNYPLYQPSRRETDERRQSVSSARARAGSTQKSNEQQTYNKRTSNEQQASNNGEQSSNPVPVPVPVAVSCGSRGMETM